MLAEVEHKSADGPAVAARLGTSRTRAVHYCAFEQRDLIGELERWRLVGLQKLDALAGGARPASLVDWGPPGLEIAARPSFQRIEGQPVARR